MRSERSIEGLVRARLVTGWVLIAVSLVGVLGADWDIQWHVVVGRDRTFTPPHDLILIGIGGSGVVALASILLETARARRHPGAAAHGTDFLGVLRGPLGAYLVGFGAVCSAVAFPLDTYWHALLGIDVTLWAPFHTMIYLGSVIGSLGVLYVFLSAVHLSESDRRAAILGGAGVVSGLGILLTKAATFLTPALSGHNVQLGTLALVPFPFLFALVLVCVGVLGVTLQRWPGAATMVVLAALVVALAVGALVPPLTALLVHAEHETYLDRASRIGATIVPLVGQTPLMLLTALGLDGVAWMARRSRWPAARRDAWTIAAAMLTMVLVAGLTMGLGRSPAHPLHVRAAGSLALSALLAIPGASLGWWLASTLAPALGTLRR